MPSLRRYESKNRFSLRLLLVFLLIAYQLLLYSCLRIATGDYCYCCRVFHEFCARVFCVQLIVGLTYTNEHLCSWIDRGRLMHVAYPQNTRVYVYV